MKNTIQFDRLFMLADFLEKLNPNRFDYRRWVGRNWRGKQDLSCGTRACALGWAATMPYFRKLGLRILKDNDSLGAFIGMTDETDPRTYNSPFKAGRIIFGLEEEEFNFLFTPSFAPPHLGFAATPKQVAQHIRDFTHQRKAWVEHLTNRQQLKKKIKVTQRR